MFEWRHRLLKHPRFEAVRGMDALLEPNGGDAGVERSTFLQTRVLTLNDGDHLESCLHRLEKGWVLQFRLGPSLFGRKVEVYTNHPCFVENEFVRDLYRQLPWRHDGQDSDDSANYAVVPLVKAGPFHYYFTCKDSGSVQRGSGFFLVDPTLTYGENDEVLPLDCIQCQTYLSKCLGPFHQWEQRLRVAKESGYNVIHFTPLQQLGKSRSSYSLSNQLVLDPRYSTTATSHTLEDVEQLVKKMRVEWKVLSVCDIVLNHSANESPWLQEHPESAYNLENSPHLRPAYLLDRVLWHFSVEISEGKWESSGIPVALDQEEHLSAVRAALHGYFLPQVKIHELFLVNIDDVVQKFYLQAQATGPLKHKNDHEELAIIQDPQYRRLQSTVNLANALEKFNVFKHDARSEAERLQCCCRDFRHHLERLNQEVYDVIHIHLSAAVENVLAGARYQRIQCDGPHIARVSRKHPLVPNYFTHYGTDSSLTEEEKLIYSDQAKYLMAHNGWVMNDDPLRNFAEPGCNVYLRRELIAWGDSVKLRYGQKPEDAPYLWQHMLEYAQTTARIFHGIRLDNCHSTPIHLAEFILDAARKVRPDLYVIAELFTQSEDVDNIFVNRLGINSLIREAMSAYDAHEEGRLVYRFGGAPVGAFFHLPLRPLNPGIAHALFLDLTHDNPSPIEKRSVYDLLPSTALVSMACCATGSNRGFDELVPHHIHVVDEERLYPAWSDVPKSNNGFISFESGIILAKLAVNQLHFDLGRAGFSEVYVDQIDPDIVAVTRHCPTSHHSVILVAFTSFQHPNDPCAKRYVRPLKLPGIVDEVIFEAHLVSENPSMKFVKDAKYINGLLNYRLEVRRHLHLHESKLVALHQGSSSSHQEIDFINFLPGCVVAFRVSLNSSAKSAIVKTRSAISRFGFCTPSENFSDSRNDRLSEIISNLSLADLNYVLFRCDAEERDEGRGGGAYEISKIGALPYCGLQGVISLLANIRLKNDLGHPLCDNLRCGDWLLDYIIARLKNRQETQLLSVWFENVFIPFKSMPRYLIPCYFDAVVTGIYSLLLNRIWTLMSKFVSDGSSFSRFLALGSVILSGIVHSAPLPRLSEKVTPPPLSTEEETDDCSHNYTTLSAGLPHFSTGYMRNWGRDTFISLRGLFLIVSRHLEARLILLGYAGCLRHGLIPNLLDGGVHARFNCRDAVWWWLQAIQDYCNLVPEGHCILKDSVLRLFPSDNAEAFVTSKEQKLEDVMQEALDTHYGGMTFRERNAGYNLDRLMKDEGFNNQIGVDHITGFVFGGNVHNCGTWMDKMGNSESLGTKGKPATPRDGSAIEIVGLCKSTLRWLVEMNRRGLYSYNSVTFAENGISKKIPFDEWQKKIEENFEKYFWIPKENYDGYQIRSDLVNASGIYKDTVGATQAWGDYQLRCNFPIAMVVAPELFHHQHAWTALQNAEKHLLGPLGMKTLIENDWAYNGYYTNNDQSTDPKVAGGYNYHQGPEWLWPLGYFLRAKLHFATYLGQSTLEETVLFVKKTLSRHFEEVQKSPWRGLPELTNRNGAHCPSSCPVQAWSMGCLLEVLLDLGNISQTNVLE